MPGKTPKGVRYGGRQKGTPNKASDETKRLIEKALGGSPLEKMAILAKELLDGDRVLLVPVMVRDEAGARMEAEASDAKAVEVATKLLSEVAQYHSPKRKAIEVTGADGAPIGANVVVMLPDNGRTGSA